MPGKASNKGARRPAQEQADDVPLYMQMAADDEEFGEEGSENEGSNASSDDDEHNSEVDDGADDEDPQPPQRGNSLYRLPTGDEMRQLKETEQLFKSNLFRLQIEELVGEVQVNYEKQKFLEQTLHLLKSTLDNLQSTKVEKEYTATSFKGVYAPLPPLARTPVKVRLMAPGAVSLVGSYLLHTNTKPDLNVDVAVEMPKEMFQDKDHMNYRYFAKRACFLAWVASTLGAVPAFKDMRFEALGGNANRPILVIRPADPEGRHKTKFVIRVIPSLPAETFKSVRLTPDRNNVRPRHVSAVRDGSPHEDDDGEAHHAATPHYNNAILADMMYLRHIGRLHSRMADCPAMAEAAMLLKVWLRQRTSTKGSGFAAGLAGVNGFVLTMVMLHLFETKRANKHMSSYQLFRMTIEYIAHSDWAAKGLAMESDPLPSDTNPAPGLDAFRPHFDVVLLDHSGRLNLLAECSLSSYHEIRREAQLTMQYLDDGLSDGFDVLFMTPVSFYSKCDHFIHIRDVPDVSITDGEELERTGDFGLNADKHMAEHVAAILRKGLGDRVGMVATRMHGALAPWDVTEAPPQPARGCTIGLSLVPENTNRLLDKGPAPTEKEAAAVFREFWGDKAELRRFKDGSILEAVVWEQPAGETATVTEQMAMYLLERHAQIDAQEACYVGAQAEELLAYNGSSSAPTAHSEAAAQAHVMAVFTSLSKQLRGMRDLPLRVNAVAGVHPALRYTEVNAPRADERGQAEGVPPFREALDVTLHFETSAKWPDDFNAIQDVKTAFYLKIADLLVQDQQRRLREIDADEAMSKDQQYDTLPVATQVARDFIDVHKGGLTFRLRIHCDREEFTLRHDLNDPEAARQHEIQYERRQRHALAITDLYFKYPTFAQAVRLFKRWVHAHMFTGHVSDEALELLVASVYTNPRPYTAPASALCGFWRTLALLAHWGWDAQALIVNVGGQLTAANYADIQTETTTVQHMMAEAAQKGPQVRQTLPAMMIATPLDLEAMDKAHKADASPWTSVWTAHGRPSDLVLRRMVAFADAALKAMQQSLSFENIWSDEDDGADISLAHLFVTPLHDYDVLVAMRHSAVPRYFQNIAAPPGRHRKSKKKYKNIELGKMGEEAVAGFDPAAIMVDKLTARFGEQALVFHNRYGGDVVGLAWRPKAFVPRPFSLLHSTNSVPVSVAVKTGEGKKARVTPVSIIPNTPGMLAAIQSMGGDALIDRVTAQ